MRYRKERGNVICRELFKLSLVQETPVTSWKMKEGLFMSPAQADADPAPWKDFNTAVDKWTGLDRNDWFTAEVTVPESFAGKPLSLLFSTQANGWDANNPQFLVFVDGEAQCGLDTNHKDVFITPAAEAGRRYRVDLQAYTGSAYGELRLITKIVEFSPLTQALYYDLITPLRALERMDENDKTRIDLEVAVEKAINAIDLREPCSEAFYTSLEAARRIIREEVYDAPSHGPGLGRNNEITATCVGHTHIDVAWWWTVAQTRQKASRSFATALKYMDEYPDYVFMSSQPQLYKFVKEDQPELYARIKERAAEGRWEPEGGMWLEADCNLTSGESLVRQFIYGKRFFRDEFGVDSKILWLPDVFGYSAALPQIMKLCGVEYFMTTKLSWNQYNRMPFDTFWWRGIDGSRIFTHMITTTGAKNPMKDYFTTYNGNLHPNDVMGAWERYQQKEINNDVLISYGHGDGGGGPTRDMIETGLRMTKGINGAPKTRLATAGTYFTELKARLKDDKRLPSWVGELYFEYHRGTYTSMARNKRANRKSELMLQDLEFLSVLAEEQGLAYPEAALREMWETVLLNQFHDILPGTSIKEVYEVTKAEYEAIAAKGSALLNERLQTLAKAVPGDLAAFNTLGFDRGDVAFLPEGFATVSLMDAAGNAFPCQKTWDGKNIAYIPGIPAKGALGLKASHSPAKTVEPFVIDGYNIDTPFHTARFDDRGFITSLIHKETGREVLLQGGVPGNELRVYEDKPMDYDNWDIDVYYTEKSWLADAVSVMEWAERGPVRATLYIERPFLQSVIRQWIHFYADMPRIDFETKVDWKQSQLLLKARFGVDVNATEATYDIQFGNVKRPTHMNTSWDAARFETCAHKWADVSEGGFGVSLLNDCKYGHTIHDGVMALTLIKSGTVPNPVTDQEEHVFTYAILPHGGTWREGKTLQAAYSLNVPVYTAAGTGAALKALPGYITADAGNVVVETVKKTEAGQAVAVRMYEAENTRTKTQITLAKKARRVYEADCLENRGRLVASDAQTFCLELKPFEIKTIIIEL